MLPAYIYMYAPFSVRNFSKAGFDQSVWNVFHIGTSVVEPVCDKPSVGADQEMATAPSGPEWLITRKAP